MYFLGLTLAGLFVLSVVLGMALVTRLKRTAKEVEPDVWERLFNNPQVTLWGYLWRREYSSSEPSIARQGQRLRALMFINVTLFASSLLIAIFWA